MYEVTGRLENVNNYINKKEATLIDDSNISYGILLSDNPKECIITKQDAYNVTGKDNPTINKESIYSILFDNFYNTLLDANRINSLNLMINVLLLILKLY